MASLVDEEVDVFGGGDEREAATERAHDTYVVKIKGQQFAVGLLWNNFENKSSAVAEARAMAAKPNIDCDLFCVRQGGSQYGLGRKVDGQAKNMISLAGALADARGGNWLGAFKVADGYYLVAVRDDDIYPETDKFYGDEIEAKSRFEDLLSMTEWGEVFAPDDFGVAGGATELSLEGSVARARGPRLQDTDRIGSMSKWLVFGVVAVALLGGGAWYLNYQQEQDFLREQADRARAFDETVNPQSEIVIPPMPWEGKPLATAYLASCEAALRKAVMTIPGWNTVGLACEGNTARMSLDRNGELGAGGGTINWIRWALDKRGLEHASASPVGENLVEVTWPLDEVENSPVELETPSASNSRRYLQSWFEESFTPISFPGTESTDFVVTLSFLFKSPFEPTRFGSILEKIPGMTIERVVVDLSDYSYSVEGSVYEKLPLPENLDAPSP